MSPGYRYAGLGIASLLALQIVWHAWLFPPMSAPPWLITALFALPLLPSTWMLIRRDRHAPFWGAVAALLYFCHGLMEAWATPDVRWLALTETALSVLLIFAASWGGLKARFARKNSAPTL